MARIDRLAEWNSKVAAIPAAIRKELEATLTQNANEFATRLHTNVPKETGALDQTIKITDTNGKPLSKTISVGDHDSPAAPVEFGHMDHGTHVKAVPFFFPLLRVLRKRLNSRMNRAMRKAISGFLSEGSLPTED